MRILVARCSATYSGKLNASLPVAERLIVQKSDGTVLVHGSMGSKALFWMGPPCTSKVDGSTWTITHSKTAETLVIDLHEVLHEHTADVGVEPGLVKEGVERDLQALLADQVHVVGNGLTLVGREWPTPIGPVDHLLRDAAGGHVAVEVKRRGEIDGVEQLTRYLDYLNRDPRLRPVRGVLAAQSLSRQARTLAADRQIQCVTLDYDAMRGVVKDEDTLF
ncbi:endonuclease NucS [Blastococcus sp. BMG 814]|uniref:Endonuclease NucS n=1 Tax=Blastococcus carthaginiensis TaxID=3050034 RepID=A0ABT9IHK0_9ACTN|nr:endonuclease NucS [Blastococcus carthaginiensis]MDP5185058.1 endonuclease NucS [Blastococcus carthaginiensis]